jgi:fructose/tagatose bisphosphate aldolase
MPTVASEDILSQYKGIFSLNENQLTIENEDTFRETAIDSLLKEAVFGKSKETRGLARFVIKSAALQLGAVTSSIQELYEARGRGEVSGFTVPAINIRGLTFETARAIFRSAHKINCSANIFEIAKSEIGYTFQRPHEYTTVILAAAIKEKHIGPVFIQGDHFQINAGNFAKDPKKEVEGLKSLIEEGISGGFYNIDIDTSTLVDLSRPNTVEQQRPNFEIGADLTAYIRQLEPNELTISVGGEIGEVGKENSNPEELKAYMNNFNSTLNTINPSFKGISKISVQTGTEHGGTPGSDGKVEKPKLDFDTLGQLSIISRKEYKISGAVQHGASTLPAEMFHRFPELETAEIHLATDFQNMVYDTGDFPQDFKEEIYAHLRTKFAKEKKEGMTDEQFIYKTRKKGFSEFKERFWDLSQEIKDAIGKKLEARMDFLFNKLNVKNTKEHVDKTVKIVKIQPDLQTEIEWS